MRESPALVVGVEGPTWDGRIYDNDAIILGVTGVLIWEGGVSQCSFEGIGSESNGVDVQGVCPTLPQLVFHRSLALQRSLVSTAKADG